MKNKSGKSNSNKSSKVKKFDVNDKIDFTEAINSSIYGICIADKNSKFVFVNDATAKMYGYKSPKELIGKSWKILYDKSEIERFKDEVTPEFSVKGFWSGEAIGKKQDGSNFYQEVTLSYGKDGNITRIVKDITIRKNFELALEESELKYRSLIDNLHEGVFYVDNNAIMMYANKRTCEMFGYSISELIGKNSYILLYDKNDIKIADRKNRLRKQGISDAYELRCKKKNGELIWCYVSGTPYYDIKGNIIGSTTIITDITEQKLSEEALRKSEIKFQTIFMLSVDAIGVSKNGINVLVNPAFLNLFGYENYEEVIGKPEMELMAPGERKKILEYTRKRALGEHAPATYVTRGLKNGGIIFSLEIHVSSYEVDNETFSIAVMRDITELELAQKALRESEENYRTLVNTSPDAIVVTNLNEKLTLVNQRAVELFGYSDSIKIIGKKYFDFISKNDHNKIDLISKEIYKDGYVVNRELDMLKKGGLTFPAELSASIIKDFEGKPKGVVSIIRDITKRRQDENQLRKYGKEQAELNATKDKFYSIIAHDLRSPFQTLLGYSDMLRSNVKDLKPEKISGYSDYIHKATTETYSLLEDLLQWTGSQTGRIKAYPEMIYVIELIYSVIKIYKDSAKSKDIVLYSNVIEDLFLYTDRNMVTTIIRNFVSNAIKFTKREGQIVLDAKEDNNNISISVTDTGVGIAKENISKLFRIDSTFSTKGTEKEKGTGLGLIICKEFAEKNEGRIKIESKVGKGSTFTLLLPKAQFTY
jgi:PAS domain S-box-containing protein